MTQTIRDRYNMNLLLVVLFILGIGASLYLIYSLPLSLRLSDGYQPDFIPVYLATGLSFLVGLYALVSALRYKKEIVVFRDKIVDKEEEQREAAEQAGRTTISLESVKAALNTPGNREALNQCLQSVCKQINAGQGALYATRENNGKRIVELHAGYALSMGESTVIQFEFGEGIVGQVAATGNTIFIDDVPEGYITVLSGLGKASPRFLMVVPVKDKDHVAGVLEIASFSRATEDERKFVEECAHLMVEKFVRND